MLDGEDADYLDDRNEETEGEEGHESDLFHFVELLVYVEWEGKAGRGSENTFCACRSCKDHRTGRGRAIMTRSKPRLVPNFLVMDHNFDGLVGG